MTNFPERVKKNEKSEFKNEKMRTASDKKNHLNCYYETLERRHPFEPTRKVTFLFGPFKST